MQRTLGRACLIVALCNFILLANVSWTSAQDLPPQESKQSNDSLPAPLSTSEVAPDDPIMQAIRERAAIASGKPTSPLSSRSKTSRKSADRWSVAERLLRQARIMERDADSFDQLGESEAANTLRQLAATTREKVAQMLQIAEKTVEEKPINRLPLKTFIP